MQKLIYTLAIYFILFIQTVCASYSWVQLTTLSSFERDRATGFSIGDKLYFGTGYINSIASSDFWEYNTLTGTWTQIADIVGNRHGAVGFSNDGKGYICMGHQPIGYVYFNDLQEYNPSSNSWTFKASFPQTGRYGGNAFVIDGTAYIVGGNLGSASGPYSNSMVAYDFATDSWSFKSNYPGTLSYYRTSFTLNGFGYVGSGVKLGPGGYTYYDTFYSYNPISDTWSPIPSYPGGSYAGMTSFVFQQQAFVGLGTDNSFNPNNAFFIYDPTLGIWNPGPTFTNGPLRSHGVGLSTSSRAFFGTGYLSGNSLDDLWELTETLSLHQVNGEAVSILYQNGSFIISGKRSNSGTIEVFNTVGQRIALIESTGDNTVCNLRKGLYIIIYSESNKILFSEKLFIQ